MIRLLIYSVLLLYTSSLSAQSQTLKMKIKYFAGYEDMDDYFQLDTTFYSYTENKSHHIKPTFDEYGIPSYYQDDINDYDAFYTRGINEEMFVSESKGINYFTDELLDSMVYYNLNNGFISYRQIFEYDAFHRVVKFTELFNPNNSNIWKTKIENEYIFENGLLHKKIIRYFKDQSNAYERMVTDHYTYDSNELLSTKTSYIDEPGESQILFLEASYHYTEDQLVDSIHTSKHAWSADIKQIKNYKHIYDENNNKIESWIYFSNANVSFELREKHFYIYNDKNQMILHEHGRSYNDYLPSPQLYYTYNEFGNLSRVSNYPENNTGNDPFTNHYIYEDFIVATKDQNQPQLIIAPNPAVQTIQFLPKEYKFERIEIVDNQGKIVLSFDQHKKEILISSLPSGMYYCRLFYDNEIRNLTFQKM